MNFCRIFHRNATNAATLATYAFACVLFCVNAAHSFDAVVNKFHSCIELDEDKTINRYPGVFRSMIDPPSLVSAR